MFITCGDPAKDPATYTRFILPFAYCPTFKEKSNDKVCYEKTEPEDLMWRKKYLTYETADVLFKRAKWFTLKDSQYPLEVNMHFRDCAKNEHIAIHIKPPSLILFEWPERDGKCSKHCTDPSLMQCPEDKHNILRTGFLVLELYFPEHNCLYPTIDNLLEMNELFRYWQQPFEGHEDKIDKNIGYKKLLANLPFIHGSAETIAQKQNPLELYFERWASLLDIPVRDEQENHWQLFPQQWMQNARKFVSGEDGASPGWAIYSDNRTFVWTCAIMQNGGNELRTLFNKPKGKASDFGHWIKLLNVDQPGENIIDTNKHTQFEKKWAKERTYKRWEEDGTFYGFNYHCGAMIGPHFEEPPLWKHFGQMYFDQILLLLYIRVALFRFSMKLNRISEEALGKETEDASKWREKFQQLRWSFALFTDLYQFPLLSNQQQAIEMYSLARIQMDLDALFNEVKEEIEDSHEYLSTKEAIEQSDMMARLTVVATIGLVFGLAFSFLGMNIFKEELWDVYTGLSLLTISVLVGVVLLALVIVFSKKIIKIGTTIEKQVKKVWRSVLHDD